MSQNYINKLITHSCVIDEWVESCTFTGNNINNVFISNKYTAYVCEFLNLKSLIGKFEFCKIKGCNEVIGTFINCLIHTDNKIISGTLINCTIIHTDGTRINNIYYNNVYYNNENNLNNLDLNLLDNSNIYQNYLHHYNFSLIYNNKVNNLINF